MRDFNSRRGLVMNREQQRKLRELKKALPKMLAEKIRPYKFKKRDERVWHVTGGYVFSMHVFR